MYFSLGRKEDAKRMLNIARAQAPKSAHILAYLGSLELASGEARSGEQSFASSLALDSTEVLALIGMGVIRYQEQRWADSVKYLEGSRPPDPNSLYMLCDAYFKIKRTEDAMVTVEVIRALGSDDLSLLTAVDKLVVLHA